MLTMGAPHSSAAAKHCSGVSCFLRMWAGYWILPQPAQARLQRKSGSSMSTSGYCFRPLSFCLSTYEATVHIWVIGTPTRSFHVGQLRSDRSDRVFAAESYLISG